jgi:hypothetical protein
MSEAHTGRRGSGALDGENGNAAVIATADFLTLAAAPTFAIMALLTGVLGGGSPDALCSIANASPLSGMVPMYLLMSAFHSAPWLKRIASWRSAWSRAEKIAVIVTDPAQGTVHALKQFSRCHRRKCGWG